MDRYLCIHGHFYQPPRENPWLEDVELQDSAYPYHDWNERITAECYAPNSSARIQDNEGYILDIVNNYSQISFNIGPTLLSWMQVHAPGPYQAILEADRLSRERFSGHGSAMAQAYGHMIMPLSNSRDKRTQVIWGIRDFQHRFGRKPEGMWLPETAVDLESLDRMAEQGIKFTVLSPYQAHRIRQLTKEKWHDVTGGRIDPKHSYLCRLPSGRTISIFFYDGPVAQEVAFSGMLKRGEDFANRLVGTFTGDRIPQLVHIATDGETYGHHHRFGDMALAYCLRFVEERGLAKLTVYGEFLKKHPPRMEVEIFENTSWSCAHGVERWRDDCGCRIGGGEWHQKWRAPVRAAMDWLRDRLIPLYEDHMGRFTSDPWKVRDEYIEVILDRKRTKDFLHRHCHRELSSEDTTQALQLLEMQRQAMLMYTSCGWFFDEVSGIESTQTLCYAGRALQLTREITGIDLEDDFLARLRKAPSNIAQWKDAAHVYEIAVKPVRLDLKRVAAHHAIASLFHEENGERRIFCYSAEDERTERISAGMIQLSIGRTRIRSEITRSEGIFSYAVLHLGAQNLNAGVRLCRGEDHFDAMKAQISEAFERSEIPEIVRLMDHHFGTDNYTLWHLFKDEQRKVLRKVMALTLEDIENSFRAIFNNHFTLVRFLHEIGTPIPRELAVPVEIALNSRLRDLLESGDPDLGQLRRLGEDVRKVGAHLNEAMSGRLAGTLLVERLTELAEEPADLPLLQYLIELLDIFEEFPFEIQLWEAQNIFFSLYRPALSRLSEETLDLFQDLGRKLRIKVE
jgi:alpha-amylase/alpha-mannosidase (GH57 family)